MAQFYLDRDAKSEIGYSSTPVTVNGTAGNADRILLRGNAANVTVGAAVEIVDLYGDSSAYEFVNEGGRVALYRGEILVARVASNDKTTELRFADGALVMAQDTETGALVVGGQQVSNEKAAYAGDELNTDHKSEAGGGSGPQPGPGGEGKEYKLPDDLGDGNIISSGTGDDTYTGTLNRDSQIVDASAADNDTLNLSYGSTNNNGAIVNVENINATWTAYNGKAVFDAENVQHVAGSNITIGSARAGATDALVNMVQNHHVIAGENISGTLTVGDASDGARVTMNNASTLVIQTEQAAPSKDSITVNAGKDFALKLKETGKGMPDFFQDKADGNGAVISSDRAGKAILVNAEKDLTVTLDVSDFKDGVAANIISSGEGKVTADIGTANNLNISGLQVDVVKMKGDNNVAMVVDRGQHLDIATGAASHAYAFSMQTYTDDSAAVKGGMVTGNVDGAGDPTTTDLIGNTNSYALTADLSAGGAYGEFDISDGNIGTLNLVLSGDTTVAKVTGTGELAKTTKYPVRLADSFVFSGRGNATVLEMEVAQDDDSQNIGEGGVTVAAGKGWNGLLTVGQAGAGVSNGTVVGGDGGSVVNVKNAIADGEKLVHLGGTGVDTLEIGTTVVSGATSAAQLSFDGGAGNDKVNINAKLTVGGTGGQNDRIDINMGAGDDVITVGATDGLVVSDSGKLVIDFGDGTADTLVLKNTLDVSSFDTNIAIRNLDVLDVSDAGGDAKLTIMQDQMDAWDFRLKGASEGASPTDNRLIVKLNGTDDLDLSGMKVSDTSTSHMTVQNTASGSTASSATITLDKVGIHTTIVLQTGDGSGADNANGTAEKHIAIENFKGNEDALQLTLTKELIADYSYSGGKFSTVNSEWTTLDAVLNGLAAETKSTGTSGDLIGFKFESSTYFMVMQGSEKTFGADDTVIQLVGDGYEAADLAASTATTTLTIG